MGIWITAVGYVIFDMKAAKKCDNTLYILHKHTHKHTHTHTKHISPPMFGNTRTTVRKRFYSLTSGFHLFEKHNSTGHLEKKLWSKHALSLTSEPPPAPPPNCYLSHLLWRKWSILCPLTCAYVPCGTFRTNGYHLDNGCVLCELQSELLRVI